MVNLKKFETTTNINLDRRETISDISTVPPKNNRWIKQQNNVYIQDRELKQNRMIKYNYYYMDSAKVSYECFPKLYRM